MFERQAPESEHRPAHARARALHVALFADRATQLRKVDIGDAGVPGHRREDVGRFLRIRPAVMSAKLTARARSPRARYTDARRPGHMIRDGTSI